MRFKIDADSHYINPFVYKYTSAENFKNLPKFLCDTDGRLVEVQFEKDPIPLTLNIYPPSIHNSFAGFSNLEKRLKDFENLGIGFQVLNPQEHAMRFSYLVDKELAIDMAQSYNRSILESVRKYPDKFIAPALIALQDIDWSLSEIKWAAENGFTNILIDTAWLDVNDPRPWPIVSAPRFEEICAECERLDMLITFHHSMHHLDYAHTEPYSSLLMNDLFPSHHMLTVIGLVTSGILDRHPSLRVLMSEGLMRYILPTYKYLKSVWLGDVDRYFKENFWFTIETEQKTEILEFVKKFGAEGLVFSTDYPHDDPGGEMKFVDHKMIDAMPELTDEQKDLICYKNAVKIFRLNLDF